ncbi:hypothetical protein Patl1_14008 [Pistacia atlantica]|uniref:Uncharacterized protein n=1 Tax=Pistacia atlantica TaxID=434234 RepID=A0ACC1AVX7_9ROSI|nr:hypothetical protein Patl1_14008 [Pistacia atlantica]
MSATGTITVASIYAPEIYPTAMRSTGYGVASAVGRIGGMVMPACSGRTCHRVSPNGSRDFV